MAINNIDKGKKKSEKISIQFDIWIVARSLVYVPQSGKRPFTHLIRIPMRFAHNNGDQYNYPSVLAEMNWFVWNKHVTIESVIIAAD